MRAGAGWAERDRRVDCLQQAAHQVGVPGQALHFATRHGSEKFWVGDDQRHPEHLFPRQIIVEGSGTHFDPKMVEAFLAVESEFEKFKDDK